MSEDELADDVEQLVVRLHALVKFVPLYAMWIDILGVVLAEGPVERRAEREDVFYVRATADRAGTFSHLLMRDGLGNSTKVDVNLNSRSICVGAGLDAEVTFTYYK